IHNATIVRGRIGGRLSVLRDAAPTAPEIAEIWARIEAEFYGNQRAVVENLHERRALRRGLGVERAADILWRPRLRAAPARALNREPPVTRGEGGSGNPRSRYAVSTGGGGSAVGRCWATTDRLDASRP
ncbi:MAG: hypothetical protein KGI93_08830, partial [Acidobacteriota bacterium]|nr:hypothetical protein [Acidobacteriota bacterium]